MREEARTAVKGEETTRPARGETSSFREALFHPRSVAVVGASKDPKKWGFHLMLNMIQGGYAGRIYPVNPREKEILGCRVYASVADIPEPVAQVLLVIPPSDALGILHDCGKNRARIGVVITAGFGEISREGRRLEEEMARVARGLGMRLVGPNCQGMVSVGPDRLYAHMPPQFPEPGPLGVVSQSGNLATSIIELAKAMGLGFSRIISSGNEADLQTSDFIEYLSEDEQTEVILSYLEGIKDGERFIRTAKEVASQKPLLMVKAGQTEAGLKAALSHTGALSGSDKLFDGLCQQTGVVRAETIEEMIDIACALVAQPLPKGRRVGILTFGGGWGVLAADYCAKAGLVLPELPSEMIRRLDEVLPPWWNRMNPVDMVAGYRKGDLIRSLDLFLDSEQFDGVLMLGLGWRTVRGGFLKASAGAPEDGMAAAGQDWIDEERAIFSDIQELGRRYQKPIVLASDMLHLVPGYDESVRSRRVAAYPSLTRAVKAYVGLVRRSEALQSMVRE